MDIKVSTHVEKEFGVRLRYHELIKLSEKATNHRRKVYNEGSSLKVITFENEDGQIESISTNNYVLTVKREGNKPGTYCHFFPSMDLPDNPTDNEHFYFNVCHDGICTFMAIRKDVEDVLGTLQDAFEWLIVPKEIMSALLVEFIALRDAFDIPELSEWVVKSSQDSIDRIKNNYAKYI